jgi:hypothetical protein
MTQQLSQPSHSVPKTESKPRRRHAPKVHPRATVKYMLAGGSVLLSLGLLMDFRGLMPSSLRSQEVCQRVVRADATLSRASLAKLIAVPERAPQSAARKILSQPYCTLPALQVRAGAMAQREAYPLDFDSQAWLVVLYEGEEYAGYAFSFRH